jgi:predicted RecA/RadA family phage recombinase
MKTYISTGEKIDVLAPAAITAGAGILIGSLFGIAQNTAAIDANLVILTKGVVDMAKAPSQAWTVGALVYWDNTAKVATTTVGSNKLIGVAVLAVAGGAGDIVGRVRLNGAFIA